jgi:alginate O-acetyltransferase complex protein AlgJ
MVRRYRHYWVLLTALLLALPLIVTVFAPAAKSISVEEARVLAPEPELPRTFAGWRIFPRQMDAYLQDHFGLRPLFLRAYALLMSHILSNSGNAEVLVGPQGWMFFRSNSMVEQSAGTVRRDDRVLRSADLLAAMHAALVARDIRLLVALPPNSATIYPDQLPMWARNRGQPTEYDVLLEALAARGVLGVDLRPAIRAAQAQGKVYHMHDTHWTARGALAGFDAIVQADSHPDWALDPRSVLGPPATLVGGDLARMLGVAADVTEQDPPLALAPGKREPFGPVGEYTAYVASSGHSGPTIMIFGDSYTQAMFAPMLLRQVGRVVWLHHQFCGFDWHWIDEFHPDEVWWMPNERYMLCGRDSWPVGLPRLSGKG